MSNSVDSAAGGSGGGLFVYDESRDTYDLNTRILATVVICLACVVVVMVFLHLYVRQVLLGRRRGDLRLYASDPAGHDDRAGLDPSAISALPTHAHRADAGGEAAECAICLGAVEEEEVVRAMPGCKHAFHVGCIDVWLASHSAAE